MLKIYYINKHIPLMSDLQLSCTYLHQTVCENKSSIYSSLISPPILPTAAPPFFHKIPCQTE